MLKNKVIRIREDKFIEEEIVKCCFEQATLDIKDYEIARFENTYIVIAECNGFYICRDTECYSNISVVEYSNAYVLPIKAEFDYDTDYVKWSSLRKNTQIKSLDFFKLKDGTLGKIIQTVKTERLFQPNFNSEGSIAVEFEKPFDGGHSCNGNGKYGRCWYVNPGDIYIDNGTTPIPVITDDIKTNDFDKLTKAVETLTKEVKKREPFQEAMTEAIIEKGKEIATKDLEDRIKTNLDKFIQEKYGVLPKTIEIKNNDKTKEMKGIFHKDFDKICKIVSKNIPLMLVGGAGAGKNYTLEQVAEALDLTFYTTNAINQEYKLTGFIDANGTYHETEFYKAFKNGGMFFLDEIDASSPEALVILNSAIANRYFDFPIGRIQANENFRVVCAGNTYGTGADMVYVGRNVLDGATLDRFVVLEFEYDDEVEKQLAYDEELFNFIKDLRKAVNKASLRYIVSMRALINATKLLEIGMDKTTILKTTILKNMQKDDINIIVDKLDSSNAWYKPMKELSD